MITISLSFLAVVIYELVILKVRDDKREQQNQTDLKTATEKLEKELPRTNRKI